MIPGQVPHRSIGRLTALAVFLVVFTVPSGASDLLELDMERAISMALAESRELRDGRFTLDATDIRRRLSVLEYIPSLSFSYSDKANIKYGGTDVTSTNFKLTLSQPIFQGGRVTANRLILGIEMESQKQQLAAAADELRLSCYSAYLSYLIQEQKVVHQEEILAIAEKQVEISRTEYELGQIREIDLLETEIEVRSMAQGLEMQRFALEEAVYGLKRILGLNPHQEFQVEDELPENYAGIEFIPEIDQLIQIALEENYRIAASLLNLERRDLERKTAKNQWLPNISLDASVGITGNGLPLQKVNYEVALNMELPLPGIPVSGSFLLNSSPSSEYGNTRQVKASGPKAMDYWVNTRTAALALENALDDHQSLREDIRFEVEAMVNQYRGKRQSLKMSRDQVAIQERRLEILSREVDLGTSTRLDFVTAQNKYIEQLLSLLEGTQELLLAERSLESLLGLPFYTLNRMRIAS